MVQQWVDVRAPSDQEEGTRSQVLRWLKAIGEAVAEHEPLIELETDKVTVEVASPASGVLAEIAKGEQEEVSPGDLLGRIGPAGALPAESAAPAPAAAGPVHDAAMLAGALALWQEPRSKGSAPAAALPAGPGPAAPGAGGGGMRLSPAVRRLLTENRVDPVTVAGTGEGGRITVDDVLRAVAERGPDGASQGRAPGGKRQDGQCAGGAPGAPAAVPSHKVPHSAVRRRTAARMVQSLLHTAPHVTTVFEIDMAAVLAHRQHHRGEFERGGVALTLTAYFVRAAVDAIRAVPEANSRWTDDALEVFDSVEFGIGTAAPAGLVVPVLRRAETLDLFQTAQGIGDLVRRARSGELTPADVRGGTFTISNHGVSGSLLAAPIILHQGQAAILGVGKLEKRAVVLEHAGPSEPGMPGQQDSGDERIVIRPRCYATLTIDHRVLDGEQANRFMQVLTQRLGNWENREQ